MKVKTTKKGKKETPPKFIGRFGVGGKVFSFSNYTGIDLRNFAKENPNLPFELKPILAESKNQRGFFEGAICPLVAHYQEGMRSYDHKDQKKVRDWLKTEFNSEMVELGGKIHQVAQSTKHKLNDGFLERVYEWVDENYKPPKEALDPEKYKHWKDTVFPYGGPDNYLGYLMKIGIL